MTPIKLTKDMFPNLPKEVWEIFIVPLNGDELSIFDSRPEGRWFYHFGGLSVEDFAQCTWQRTTLSLKKDLFHPDSGADINGLVHYCKPEGKPIAGTLSHGYSKHSPARLDGIKKFIINTGRLPAPLVAIRTTEGIRVLDGCHRLAAAASCDNPDVIPLDAWIGESP